MNTIYILQDKNYNVVGATFEQQKAHEKCKSENLTFREIPFFKCDETEINILAGAIPKKYLPSND